MAPSTAEICLPGRTKNGPKRITGTNSCVQTPVVQFGSIEAALFQRDTTSGHASGAVTPHVTYLATLPRSCKLTCDTSCRDFLPVARRVPRHTSNPTKGGAERIVMTLSCPNCQAPNEVQDDCLAAEFTQAVCCQCDVNLVFVGEGAIPDEPSGSFVESARQPCRPDHLPTASRQKWLGLGLSLGVFLLNLSFLSGVAFWSLQAMKVMHDPYRLDQHVMSPALLWADGWSELHFAAARGEAEKVRRLLDEGAVLNARNGKGRTPLYESAKRGHSQVVQLLLERGADVDAREARGFTALMAAVRHGHIAELLLDGGADPNSRCGCGSTPLYHAVMAGDAALVRLLLDRGAKVNATVHGKTPLQLAEDREARDLAQVLRDHGGKTFRDYHTGQTQ